MGRNMGHITTQAAMRLPSRIRWDWVGLSLDHGIWLVVVLMTVAAATLNPDTFLTPRNLTNILIQSAVLGILVVGESLVLLAGQFDLSIESTLAFTAMVGAWLMASHSPGSGLTFVPMLVAPIMLALGGFIGLVNAILVLRLRINAFITTLAMLILLRGLTLVLTDGQSIFDLPAQYVWIGSASVSGVPVPAVLMLAVFAIAWLVTRYRVFGRHLYAVGGNPRVAFAAGIPVIRTTTSAFIIAGVLAALAGWVLAGRLHASVAGMGQGIIFDVFAAAVIGGISLQGGKGNMLDALGGVLLLGIIGNMLTLASVTPFWVDAIRGLLILLAMGVDAARASYQVRRSQR